MKLRYGIAAVIGIGLCIDAAQMCQNARIAETSSSSHSMGQTVDYYGLTDFVGDIAHTELGNDLRDAVEENPLAVYAGIATLTAGGLGIALLRRRS